MQAGPTRPSCRPSKQMRTLSVINLRQSLYVQCTFDDRRNVTNKNTPTLEFDARFERELFSLLKICQFSYCKV